MRSIQHLAAACLVLRERCVEGITANVDHLQLAVASSIGLVTALTPRIGYYAATEIAKEAEASGRSVADLVLERRLLAPEDLAQLLAPERLANLTFSCGDDLAR